MEPVPLFFNLIRACAEGTRKYPRGNPTVEHYYGRFLSAYKQFLDYEGKMTLTIGPGVLALNGHEAPPEVVRQEAVGWFITRCLDRRIASLSLHAGMNTQDLRALVGLFLWRAEHFNDVESANRFLCEMGINRIQVNQEPIATPAPVSEPNAAEAVSVVDPLLEVGPVYGGYDAEAQEAPEDPALQVAPIHQDPHRDKEPTIDHEHRAPSRIRGMKEVELDAGQQHERPTLFISEDDVKTLYDGIAEALVDNDLDRVGETLAMIRADFNSSSREDRELAFSSFYVVIRVLVDQNQEKQLFVVMRSMSTELSRITEADLYTLHLASLVSIIRYFDKRNLMLYSLHGLDIIGTQTLRCKGQIREALEAKSSDLLTMARLDTLLSLEDPELKNMVRTLFGKRGAGFLKTMLDTLYASPDRNLRKRLLEVLHLQGQVIYPQLLVALQDAITNDRAWYVKRNLLTLLSIKPPKDLVPMLEALLKADEHPKMNDLACRCLYQIPEDRAYRLGKRILRTAPPKQQVKLLGYIYVSRDSEYRGVLEWVFENSQSERVRTDALNVLGRMSTDEAVDYLNSVVANHARGKGEAASIRMAAVRAMISGKQPRALKHLLHHRKDPDKTIRAMIQKALNSTA